MSLAPDPPLRARSQAYDNNALEVLDGTVPQAIQIPHLESRQLAVDVTIPVSFAASIGFRMTIRQEFSHQTNKTRST
jgi:hypothetical protein